MKKHISRQITLQFNNMIALACVRASAPVADVQRLPRSDHPPHAAAAHLVPVLPAPATAATHIVPMPRDLRGCPATTPGPSPHFPAR